MIFGRHITKHYRGKLQTEIEDLHLGNPVMRSYYKNGFAKHYVRDHDVLRFETASNDVKGDYGINKAVNNLVPLREKLQAITERYQNVQQDILETFLDRGELRKLAEPTLCSNGKRIPGLKLDHPRQLAVMSSVVRFSHVAAGDTFTTAELQAAAAEALGIPVEKFPLGALRYELCKLRAKGLVEKLPHSRRYRLLPNGYRICLLFLKLFDKDLRPAHRRASSSLSWGPNHDGRSVARTRQAVPICRDRPRSIGGCRRTEACRIIDSNENGILVGAPITV